MKKLFTTILSLMLCALMVLGLTACGDTGSGGSGGGHVHDYIDHVCSCGDVEVYTEGLNFKKTSDGKGVSVLGFKDGVTVPETVIIPQKGDDNLPVVAIGSSAFAGSTLKFITLPEGLLCIYSDAFRDSSLNAITIPKSVTQIHPHALNTASLGSVKFVVTEGWYNGRHVTNTPSEDFAVSADKIADASGMASTLRNTTYADSGANCVWFRIAK